MNASLNQAAASHNLLSFCLLALLLAGLLLPWLVAPNAAMTLNAYDLAEWTSLHPAQAGTSPPLLVPLMLRWQALLLCALVGAIAETPRARRVAALLVCLLAVAQLPPVEFAKDLGNLNYRQQFGLALASLLLGLAVLRWRSGRWRHKAICLCALVGMATCWLGANQALAVYHSLADGGSIGLGAGMALVAYAGMALASARALLMAGRGVGNDS